MLAAAVEPYASTDGTCFAVREGLGVDELARQRSLGGSSGGSREEEQQQREKHRGEREMREEV